MKSVHIIHFSPGGTTKKTVQTIAGAMDKVTIIDHDMLRPENRSKDLHFTSDDLVIIGTMTMSRLFGPMKEIFDHLHGDNTPVVPVVMYGNGYYGKGLVEMQKHLKKRGFQLVAAGAFIGQHSHEPRIATGRPDAKDKPFRPSLAKTFIPRCISIKTPVFTTS